MFDLSNGPETSADVGISAKRSLYGVGQSYSLSSPIVAANAICKRAGDMLRVTTPEVQWATALELPPLHGPRVLATGLALNFRVLVHEGEIGVGLLTGDLPLAQSHSASILRFHRVRFWGRCCGATRRRAAGAWRM